MAATIDYPKIGGTIAALGGDVGGNLMKLVDSNGVIQFERLAVSAIAEGRRYAILRSSAGLAGQSFDHNTFTVNGNFDLIDDPLGLWDSINDRFDIGNYPGVWMAFGASTLDGLGDRIKLIIFARKSGDTNNYSLMGRGSQSTAGTNVLGFGGATVIAAESGDYVQMVVFHDQGSAVNSFNLTYNGYQWFGVVQLSDWAVLNSDLNTSDALLSFEPQGLNLSRNGADAQDLDISSGSWLISGGTEVHPVALSSAWTKRLDVAFSAGNNGGLLATGSIAANTLYYIFAGRNKTTGAIDFAADSANAGTNLSTSYDWRYLGFLRTNGSSEITPFKQTGNYFTWLEQPADFNAAPSTASNGALVTLPHCPEHDCFVDLIAAGGRHVGDALRSSALYGGHPDSDLSGYTSVSPLDSTGAWAGWIYATGTSDYAVSDSFVRVATSGGQIRLRSIEQLPNYQQFPKLTMLGVDDSQRRRNG